MELLVVIEVNALAILMYLERLILLLKSTPTLIPFDQKQPSIFFLNIPTSVHSGW